MVKAFRLAAGLGINARRVAGAWARGADNPHAGFSCPVALSPPGQPHCGAMPVVLKRPTRSKSVGWAALSACIIIIDTTAFLGPPVAKADCSNDFEHCD